MKLSPTTIAANLAAAAAEAAESANSNVNASSTQMNASATVSTATSAAASASSIYHSTSAPMSTNPPGKSTPKDTQVVATILKEMGIVEYEPRVLPQLVEFAYRSLLLLFFLLVRSILTTVYLCRICLTCDGGCTAFFVVRQEKSD